MSIDRNCLLPLDFAPHKCYNGYQDSHLGDVMQSYSVAEARDRFAEILHDLEKTPRVEVTRRGKAVAVLISIEEYERLCSGRRGFLDGYEEFREKYDLANLDIDPDEIWGDVRDKSPGREVNLWE